MSILARILFIIGSIFMLVGSFLPWRRDGDFISYWTQGIQIYPSIKDNGGLLVVALNLVVIILVFRPPSFVEDRMKWSNLIATVLVIDALFHFGKVLIDRKNSMGLVGAPTIQIGLAMVLIGSVLLLLSVVNYYHYKFH